jgi:hypothetical protein
MEVKSKLHKRKVGGISLKKVKDETGGVWIYSITASRFLYLAFHLPWEVRDLDEFFGDQLESILGIENGEVKRPEDTTCRLEWYSVR